MSQKNEEEDEECHRKGQCSDRDGSRVGHECHRDVHCSNRSGSRSRWIQGRKGKYSQTENLTENAEQQCEEEDHQSDEE